MAVVRGHLPLCWAGIKLVNPKRVCRQQGNWSEACLATGLFSHRSVPQDAQGTYCKVMKTSLLPPKVRCLLVSCCRFVGDSSLPLIGGLLFIVYVSLLAGWLAGWLACLLACLLARSLVYLCDCVCLFCVALCCGVLLSLFCCLFRCVLYCVVLFCCVCLFLFYGLIGLICVWMRCTVCL